MSAHDRGAVADGSAREAGSQAATTTGVLHQARGGARSGYDAATVRPTCADANGSAGEHFAAGAIYGTIVYLTILVLLEEDRTDPEDAAAILVATALVFWLAHVYAHLVPRIAQEGRLLTGRFRRRP